MNCRKIQLLLNKHIDGELPPENINELKGHLSACPDCSNKLNELKELKLFVKAAPAYAVNPYLWTRISASLEQIPSIAGIMLVPKILKLWILSACALIFVSSMLFVNLGRNDFLTDKEGTAPIQKIILEIPAEPENMEIIALNLAVYTDNNMEVNYAIF